MSPHLKTSHLSPAEGQGPDGGAMRTREVTSLAQSLSGAEEDTLPNRGNYLLQGGYVLTMDPRLGDIARGSVHVRDGIIVSVDKPDGAGSLPAGVDVIDMTGHIVLPGFVDTHWHLWNSLLRGTIGDGDRSYFPVKNRLAPHFTADDTHASASLALAEAAAAGITTVNDWDHNVRSPEHADAHARAILSSGLRARYSYGNPDKLDPTQLMDLDDIERFRDAWVGSASENRISLGMAMRGPVRTESAICSKEWGFARDHGIPMTMHCGGRRSETGRYCELESMAEKGMLGPDLQIVHAVDATPEEIRLLADTGTHISLSPMSEYGSMGFPPLTALLEAGILVSLSIDTLAVPTRADMFAQMSTALAVERARVPSTPITPRRMIELATVNGATDLGLSDKIGSITPGKRADIISVSLTSLNTAPAADPVTTMVACATPSDVATVIADGRILKRNGRLLAADPTAVISRASQALMSILARAGWDPHVGVAADTVSDREMQ